MTPPKETTWPALLPCPFCQSADSFVERADFSSCYVMCNDCGARGPTSCDENEADSDATENGDAEPGELAARRLWNQPVTPRAQDRVKRLPEERQEYELGLLYNYHHDDTRQFTRWQMMSAIAHGYRIATEPDIAQPAPVEQDVERLAHELRERSRYPSGGPRISPEKAREIASTALSTLTPARAEGFKAGVEALREAKMQLEYLDGRWPTGTTPAVIARIESALKNADHG